MIKKVFSLLAVTLLFTQLFAQNPQKQIAPPLATRQISGIVTDSIEQAVTGATVTLISKTDTLKTITNEDGLFFFKDVKAWEFTLSVTSLGFRSYVKLGRYNDGAVRLTMDPIILRTSAQILKEVTVNGTPSIIYKTDTVEYKASDYVVREGSAVDELLKKMEGMEVGNNGSLTYNGNKVDKARLNGKDFMGGSVTTVTKTLPADIVEKVQIVDDYGDQAARTGIKDGNPDKLLNITTKADRSLGYIAQIAGGAGNDARYGANVSGTRINANRNYTLSANINNTIDGVAGSEGGSRPGVNATGGTTKRESAGFTYRDQWSRKVQVNMNYSYSITDVNSVNSSISQDFSTSGTTTSANESSASGNTKLHNFNFEFEDNLDSVNYLKISPRLSYSSAINARTLSSVLSGIVRQDQTGINSNSNQIPNYGLAVFFQHLFSKKGRNYTIQLSGSNRDNETNKDQDLTITYFDQTTGIVLKDSLIRRLIERENLVMKYGVSLTYTDPLSRASRINFSSEINYSGYDNKSTTNDLSQKFSVIVDSLSRAFQYSFAKASLAFDYDYTKGKYGISIGIAGLPSTLSAKNPGQGNDISRTNFNVIPVFRFQYVWSSQKRFSINYSGAATEPLFEQIQPIGDLSDPQNLVIGNPDLKISFNHSMYASYSNYFPNTRFGVNADLVATIYNNRVVANIIQIADAYNSLKYEKHFLNANGTYSASGKYTITKQLANRRYNFTLSGNIDHEHNEGMSNNLKNISGRWGFIERLSLRISASKNFDINPSFSYNYSVTDNSLPTALDSKTRIISSSIDGRNYFMKSWLIGYSAVKNFVHGINSNLSNNPFIVNTYLEKEFFQKKSLKVRLQAFDLFNQNKFINRDITETSITDTRSNILSRYLMFSVSLNLQRWKGTPTRNGSIMQRRGDGSFIY